MEKVKICSFFGHRDTESTPELKTRLKGAIVKLIVEQGVQYFLFGSASKFDELCLQIVTDLKKQYPEIVRVYVRAKERYLTEERKKSLLEIYDDTIMPPDVENAGRASYIKRNQAMIDASTYCIFYYNSEYQPSRRKYSKRDVCEYQPKSGTALAFEYALKKKDKGKLHCVVNLYKKNLK